MATNRLEFAFFCARFGSVDMEIADGILGELFSDGFLAFRLRQAVDVVALEQAMQ